ncbi:diaminobutyrate acetyltransferase [Georgenia sp. MJ173]|uniref:diaminobutyrate acetyltransferase n=1 Tax=Georgenia sunbinii TaxID=3117728 RepID=UPI002F26C115
MPQTPPAVPRAQNITTRHPSLEDGAQMWRLARDSGALDLNTSYAYLLFARDFADTCQVAVVDGEVSAFALGYRRPTQPDTLFVWQIAVDPAQRGHGLAARLLDALSDSLGVSYVEATITADNTASQRLFAGFARRRGTDLARAELFAADHFPDGHDAEGLVRIGPLRPTDH